MVAARPLPGEMNPRSTPPRQHEPPGPTGRLAASASGTRPHPRRLPSRGAPHTSRVRRRSTGLSKGVGRVVAPLTRSAGAGHPFAGEAPAACLRPTSRGRARFTRNPANPIARRETASPMTLPMCDSQRRSHRRQGSYYRLFGGGQQPTLEIREPLQSTSSEEGHGLVVEVEVEGLGGGDALGEGGLDDLGAGEGDHRPEFARQDELGGA